MDEAARTVDPGARRNVILGALMLVVGFAVSLLGALVLAGAFTDALALGFGGLGLGVSSVVVGALKLTRGLRAV